MKITEFSELTDFVSNEYLKMVDTYGVNNPTEGFMKFIERTLKKYTEVYDVPLYKLEKYKVKIMFIIQKQELKIEKAFATMPHGRIWKFFHSDLWRKMQHRDESLKKPEKPIPPEPSSAVPACVVKDVYSPPADDA